MQHNSRSKCLDFFLIIFGIPTISTIYLGTCLMKYRGIIQYPKQINWTMLIGTSVDFNKKIKSTLL